SGVCGAMILSQSRRISWGCAEGDNVYPGQFEYQRPSSVQEAVAILAGDPEAKVLAGGHSLVPAMKLRLAMPGTLVDIGRIAELKGIKVNGGATIGAMTTYDEPQVSAEVTHAVRGR